MKKRVYIATGVEDLDADIKEILDRKNIVSKPIFYRGFLLNDDIECETVILSRRLGPPESEEKIEDIIDMLKRKGIRIIFLLSADFEYFDKCLEYGIYDVVSDPITPYKVTDMYEKPCQYNDILPLKEIYDQQKKKKQAKLDPGVVLEKRLEHKSLKPQEEVVQEKKEEHVIQTGLVEESDPDGLFSVLENAIPTGMESEAEENEIEEAPEQVSPATLENVEEEKSNEVAVSPVETPVKTTISDNKANEEKEKKIPQEVLLLGEEEVNQETSTGEKELETEERKEIEEKPEEEISYSVDEPGKEIKKHQSKPVQRPTLKKFKSLITKKSSLESSVDKRLLEEEPESQPKEQEIKSSEFRAIRKEKLEKTIGVIGSEKSVGTTYVSLLLAHSLALKKKVLYVTTEDELFKTLNLTNEIEQFPFDFVKYDETLYKVYNDYDHLIYNCCTVENPTGFNLFYTLQKKILMISLLPYKMKALTAIDAAAYVDMTCILGYEKDEKHLKGVEMRSNFKDKKYLMKVQEKLLGNAL